MRKNVRKVHFFFVVRHFDGSIRCTQKLNLKTSYLVTLIASRYMFMVFHNPLRCGELLLHHANDTFFKVNAMPIRQTITCSITCFILAYYNNLCAAERAFPIREEDTLN